MTVLDAQLKILSNSKRRQLLTALLQQNPQNDGTETATVWDTDENARVIAMRHAHLPKLEAHGYIDWHRETGRVEKGEKFDDIEPLLTILAENRELFSRGERPS